MSGAAVLAEALAAGARVEWPGPTRARLLVPPDLRARVLAESDTVREVLRRAAVFRGQAHAPGPVPFLHLPEAKGRDGGCLSCGAPVDEARHFRCPLCVLAVRIVLDMEAAPEVPS